MKQPSEVITFKADEELARMLKGVRNRSEFIRTALLNALGSLCPACKGSGILTAHQQKHWDALASKLKSRACRECDETVLIPEKRQSC